MASEATVSEYMTKAPATVNGDLLLTDALDRMYSSNIRHLPVVDDGGKLTGVVTTRDVALAASMGHVDPSKTAVSTIVGREPFVCAPSTPLLNVIEQMEKERYGSVVVVEDDVPVGVFTTIDALRALRSQLTGGPVEPLVHPSHLPETPEEGEAGLSRARMRVTGASKYSGMVSWFLARL